MNPPPSNTSAATVAANESLFEDELVTLKEILPALKIGPTKWWEGVRTGIYPKPIKLGNRCTRWSKNSIQLLMMHGVK